MGLCRERLLFHFVMPQQRGKRGVGGGGEKYTLIIFGTSGAPAQISRDFWSLVRRRVRK